MKRSKAILASLKLINSSFLTHSSRTRPLHFQVTPYSQLSPCFSSSLKNQACNYDFINTHHKLHFSTKPNSLVELVSTNEWSDELEQELEKSNPSLLTHGTIMYVLKKLDYDPEKAYDFFDWVSNKSGFRPSLPIYGIMLRILGRKEFMKSFWVVIKKMGDEGHVLDLETYNTLMGTFWNAKMGTSAAALNEFYNKMIKESSLVATAKNVAEIILGSDWNDETKKKLEECNLSLSENSILMIFRELRKCPLKALSFFHWIREHLGYKHNSVTYNAILRVIGNEESIKEFWSVIKEMKSAGYDLDIDTYIKVCRNFQKTKMMKDAVELYEFMMDGLYKPSAQECSSLLRKIAIGGDPDLSLVFRVVKKYEDTGYILSKADYDGIHRSLTSVGKFDEAEKILERMKNAGYEPDNITYSQLVFGLCKARRLEEACDKLEEMEARGCVPDLKTWTILIQGHCTAGEVGEAMKLFTNMLERNYSADADLLSILVNGLCNHKKVLSAYTLVVEMVKKAKLSPWQATYKYLIKKLLEEEKLDEALVLLRMMKKHNFPPFAEPFDEYISKFGTVQNAEEFLKALSVKQFPTLSAYLNIFEAFFKEGRRSEAQDLLFKCPHHVRSHADILNLFGSSKEVTPTA